jgi:tetratricopeptide (TPR) repeat protein
MNDARPETQGRLPKLWRLLRDLAVLLLLVPIAGYAASEWRRSSTRDRAVDRHIERAFTAMASGELPRARTAVDSARAVAPEDPEVHHAMMAFNAKRAAELPHTLADADLDALDYALVALEEGPSRGMSRALLKVARGQLAYERRRATQAMELFEEARKLDPGYVHGHLAAARVLRDSGKSLEALQALEAAVDAAPANITALNNLGVHYAELKRREDAIKVYQRAIDAADNASTRLNMADALAAAGRAPEALEHLKRAAALAPDSAEVFRRLGALLQSGGNLAGAERMLLRSLDLNKDLKTAFNLGVLYQQQERYDRAAEVFGQILEARPDSHRAAYALGATLRALGDTEGAIAALRRYLSLASQIPSEQGRVAEVRGALGIKEPKAPGTPPSPAIPAPPASSAGEGAR